MSRTPLSAKPQGSGCGKVLLPLMGLMFFVAGTAALWFLTIRPLQLWWQARTWVAAECQILNSEVVSHRSSENTTYSPQITFQYEVNGVTLVSQRYSFFEISSGRGWADRVVRQYPQGSRQTCFYDPNNASEAVLIRSAGGMGFWFAMLFPWPFIAAGVLLLWLGRAPRKAGTGPLSTTTSTPAFARFGSASKRQLGNQLERSTSFNNPTDFIAGPTTGTVIAATPLPYSARSDWEDFAGPQKLKPTVSRLAAVLGIGFASLFWNGIVSLFLYELLHNRAWFMLLLLTPFVLVGLGLIGGFFYTFLTLFNPKVELALSEGAVAPGESIDVAWEVSGWVQRIREFSIVAVGEEQATYTRGTDTTTDKHLFQSLEVARVTAPEAIRFGTAVLEIPENTMHSHEGEKNKIVWTLRVQGKIPFFPDVNEHYEFQVIPQRVR